MPTIFTSGAFFNRIEKVVVEATPNHPGYFSLSAQTGGPAGQEVNFCGLTRAEVDLFRDACTIPSESEAHMMRAAKEIGEMSDEAFTDRCAAISGYIADANDDPLADSSPAKAK